jgi:hypothetical protein
MRESLATPYLKNDNAFFDISLGFFFNCYWRFQLSVRHLVKVTIRTGFTSTVLVFNTSVLDKQCTGFCPGFSRWQPIFLNCNKSISG